jgi:hypothetical protein
MTNITPPQMRWIASDREETSETWPEYRIIAAKLREDAAALRAAADQLENYERDHNLVAREWHEALMRQVKFRTREEIEQEQAQFDDYRETAPPRIEDMTPGTAEDAIRADEREQWASYFENADASVGHHPLTYSMAVRLLRGQKPFGVAQGDPSTIRDVTPPKEQS